MTIKGRAERGRQGFECSHKYKETRYENDRFVHGWCRLRTIRSGKQLIMQFYIKQV